MAEFGLNYSFNGILLLGSKLLFFHLSTLEVLSKDIDMLAQIFHKQLIHTIIQAEKGDGGVTS